MLTMYLSPSIKIKGYSSNKRDLQSYFESEFGDFNFWNDEGIDVSNVSQSENMRLMRISEKVSEKIRRLEIDERQGQPTKDRILFKAIEKIYEST